MLRKTICISMLAALTFVPFPVAGETSSGTAAYERSSPVPKSTSSNLKQHSSAELCAELALRQELPEKLRKELRDFCKTKAGSEIASTASLSMPPTSARSAVVDRDLSVRSRPPPASFDKPTLDVPFFLLRQDQYDQISYIFSAEDAPFQVFQGASFSYTKDEITKTQSASIKSFVGYSAYRERYGQAETGCGSTGGPAFLAGRGFGPFVLANGTYNQPTTANEKSALRVGINSDSLICNTFALQQQDFQLMPYVQSDFRGKAKIGGFDALWEPYYISDLVHLGRESGHLFAESHRVLCSVPRRGERIPSQRRRTDKFHLPHRLCAAGGHYRSTRSLVREQSNSTARLMRNDFVGRNGAVFVGRRVAEANLALWRRGCLQAGRKERVDGQLFTGGSKALGSARHHLDCRVIQSRDRCYDLCETECL
jgi:hypothetical protein